MEESGQLHALAALPPGKEPMLPIGLEGGCAPEPFWTVEGFKQTPVEKGI